MKTLIELIQDELAPGFTACGYDASLARVVLSNRPDLCEYQCNGAMAGAKKYHKAPLQIAQEVLAQIPNSPLFEKLEAVRPGFLNITLKPSFVAWYLAKMAGDEHLGADMVGAGKTAVLDYGGPNVAKPLHVGHLRAAIIGESLKRLYRFCGYHVLGDIHLGDWGLQMGLIIAELKARHPELPYFDADHQGAYPEEPPFTISDLEEIYPTASKKSKTDRDFAKAAHDATVRLQHGDPGCTALFHHILNVSVADLKKNYERLNVSFDLWKGESDAQKYIPDMIEGMKRRDFCTRARVPWWWMWRRSPTPRRFPPASSGNPTARLFMQPRTWLPSCSGSRTITRTRCSTSWTSARRCTSPRCSAQRAKAGIIRPETRLTFLGFGTMNGKDGKPFKTREGGVMRLEHLITDIDAAVYDRIMENRTVSEEEAREIAQIVGLAALKYGDLSNQATKNYVFDVDRFTSFEGNTGPYIQYTIVRINSILRKYLEQTGASELPSELTPAADEAEKNLQLLLARAGEAITDACADIAPHRLCQYIYEVSNAFNSFYHDHRILAEEDQARQQGWIALLVLTNRILNTCINLLGFSAPDKM